MQGDDNNELGMGLVVLMLQAMIVSKSNSYGCVGRR